MNPQNPGMGLGPHAGLGAVVNIEWSVPDKMVGLSECSYFLSPFCFCLLCFVLFFFFFVEMIIALAK